MRHPDPSAAAELRDLLADRDFPCPGCRYNLRGVAEMRCPECGLSLDAEYLRRVEARRRQPHRLLSERAVWIIVAANVVIRVLGSIAGDASRNWPVSGVGRIRLDLALILAVISLCLGLVITLERQRRDPFAAIDDKHDLWVRRLLIAAWAGTAVHALRTIVAAVV